MRSALPILVLALALQVPAPARADGPVASDAARALARTGLHVVGLWREASGRAVWQLRQHPELHRALEVVSLVERAASLIAPGFRLPVDVSPVPVLVSRPADGVLSSPFGVRRDPIRKRRRKLHRGLDFDGERGQPVRAAGPGIVTKARRNGGYGRVVYIDHGLGMETRYAHLQRIEVREGDFVAAGVQVGRIGSSGRSTGPHLHFEVRLRGAAVDPHDAMQLDIEGKRIRFIDRLARVFSIGQDREEEEPRTRRKNRPRVPRSQRERDLW